MTSMEPFDLHPPTKVLFPTFRSLRQPEGKPVYQRTIQLADGASLQYLRWEGDSSLIMSLPCEEANHCDSCDCDRGHQVLISGDQAYAIKAMLNDVYP